MSAPIADRGVDLGSPRAPSVPRQVSYTAGRPPSKVWLVLRVLGAGLLLATGAIHLDLYLTGYRTVPTIGALFLLQVITSFAIALGVLATRGRAFAAAGAGFALATLAGYVVSLRTPLFSFREVRTDAGVAAGVIELLSLAVLSAVALGPSVSSRSTPRALSVLEHLISSRAARWLAGALCVLAAAALATSLALAPATPSGSGARSALLQVTRIGGVAVLTDAAGHTLYWFELDTPTMSACAASCTAYWPPVFGTPSASAGVHGTLGTIHRSDGASQATFNGHPLYTYVADTAPGQAQGNNINLSGGRWHEMVAASSG